MHQQTFFILFCLYQFTGSTKRPLFGWGNVNQTSNKNSNNKNNNTNNEYGHSTNKQTLDKRLCDELVTFTPNLCSIYGAKVRCTIHCKLPTGLLKKGPGMLEPSKWEVVSGNEYLLYWDNSEERHDVRKIIMHDDYSTAKMPSYSDVAIIQLINEVNLKKKGVGRVCLPDIDHPPRPGMTCYVTGWGKTDEGKKSSERLKHGALKLVDKYVCNLPNSIKGGLRDRELCAGWVDSRTDVCKGDSGGSLVCQNEGLWYSVGVASRSYKCGPAAGGFSPFAVFADVAVFKEWIVNAILNDSEPL